jgi:hypothetical protein
MNYLPPMCFSSTVSFTAGIALTAVGAVTLKKAESNYERPFAAIPLLFGIQQILEGFVWLCLQGKFGGPQELQSFVYLFLFIAQVLWPFWVPLSIIQLEKKGDANLFEKALLVLGFALSIYLGYCLYQFPVSAKIEEHHILYLQHYPKSIALLSGIVYTVVTILPPFFSKLKFMWALGLLILLSYGVTAIFYEGFVVSVWCFFASIISVAVWWILRLVQQGRNIQA